MVSMAAEVSGFRSQGSFRPFLAADGGEAAGDLEAHRLAVDGDGDLAVEEEADRTGGESLGFGGDGLTGNGDGDGLRGGFEGGFVHNFGWIILSRKGGATAETDG